MLVDLHVHTRVSSPCSFIEPRDLVAWAPQCGLDAVCVTEHEEALGAEVTRDIGRELGFRVFRGMEIYTDAGDVLVFGLYEDPPHWITPLVELVPWVEREGGVIIPAHPCRGSDDLHERYGEAASLLMASSVAVETRNGGSSPENNDLAVLLARSHGLPQVGGSDAHHLMQVGRCVTWFEQDIADEAELIAALRGGRYRALYADEVGSQSMPGQ
ncbi:MAG: PHP-associated domain-containing protein [Candidatus Geothermincolia bacterium]